MTTPTPTTGGRVVPSATDRDARARAPYERSITDAINLYGWSSGLSQTLSAASRITEREGADALDRGATAATTDAVTGAAPSDRG